MNPIIAKSARVRSTPFTQRIEEYGVQAYTIYNHMLLPASFHGVVDDCDVVCDLMCDVVCDVVM